MTRLEPIVSNEWSQEERIYKNWYQMPLDVRNEFNGWREDKHRGKDRNVVDTITFLQRSFPISVDTFYHEF